LHTVSAGRAATALRRLEPQGRLIGLPDQGA